MNIRPQEVTVDGERSVRYKGSDGKMHDLAAGNGEADGGGTAQSGNIVIEVNFADDGKTYTAEELIAIVTAIMSGRGLVCISDNNWGTANERRIAFVTRIDGFEVVDGVVTIKETLNLRFSNCMDFDLDIVYFVKQVDGNYKSGYEFSK